MDNTELIERANTKAAYLDERCWFVEAKLIRELADALEAAQPAPQVPMTERAFGLLWLNHVPDEIPTEVNACATTLLKAARAYGRAIEAHHGVKP